MSNDVYVFIENYLHCLQFVGNKQKGVSLNGGNKEIKHAKFFKKQTFLTLWYAHIRVCIWGLDTFVFWKIWRVMFFCYLHFEIRLFALLPTNWRKCLFFNGSCSVLASENFTKIYIAVTHINMVSLFFTFAL